ncbi:hypothetical protein J2755_000035 [Methanohalophilus levihalophilus]|uniref:hypothetical protein n=1 Tax=Methanohalophilus levihalophilus TaxID=1431282 RepID=UPI001AE42D90|nr:hypothetical protein [Methanohalophilus levihalophilus]MBP2029115.1 hypothetical protein [Methanohalophilus levihalophilus]
MSVPVSADEVSEFPLILRGNVSINGDPAPAGTEIVVKLDGIIVGQVTTNQEGVYGDTPTSRLLLTPPSERYGDLVFSIDGIKINIENMAVITNASPGDSIIFDIDATIPEDDITSINTANPYLTASIFGIVLVLFLKRKQD